MLDWITLPRLFLAAAPLAMLLAASALAAGERRSKASRARDALGRPASHVEEGSSGARILLRGRLDVVEGPCPRFEDGAPAAAATVEANGMGALPETPGYRPDDDSTPFLARSARAAELVLTVGAERVALAGPVDVYVGSHEMDPGAPFDRLALDVRERIAQVAGAEALPHPGAKAPVLQSPIFRSLQSGVEVRAAGVLVKRSDGDRSGYRDRARWVLSGDQDAPVVLAYEGTPRYGGALTAIARGVRHVDRLRAALLATTLLGALAVLAVMQQRSTQRSDPRTGAAGLLDRARALHGAEADPHHHLADPASCAQLEADHAAAVAKLAACAADADCTAEPRGGTVYELEGCYRFRHRSPPADDTAAQLQERWTSLGCATSYEICPPPPLSMCSQGRCVERPPAPLPETWQRRDLPGMLSFYLPPGMTQETAVAPDGVTQIFRGAGIELVTDLDDTETEDPDIPSKATTASIGGYDAKVWKLPREITLSFEGGRDCVPPRCPFFARDKGLTLRARCDTATACDDAWTALQSVRFW
jgi:hypothetical protein